MKFHEKIRSFRLWLSRLAARLFPRGIYYVSGPETLPPPLSREEEREALWTDLSEIPDEHYSEENPQHTTQEVIVPPAQEPYGPAIVPPVA